MRANLQQLFAALPRGAVGSFNVLDLEMARAVLEAAENAGLPVAIGVCAQEFEAVDAPLLAHSLVAAIHEARVPAALHLDQVRPQNLAVVQQALDAGFTSIMFDGSGLSLGQCKDQTLELTELACRYVAGVELKPPIKALDRLALTRLAQDTGADAFTLIDGASRTLPNQLDQLASLPETIGTPLVMYGAAGLSDALIDRAVALGVRKVSCFLGLMNSTVEQLRLHESQPRLRFGSSADEVMRLKGSLYRKWTDAVTVQLQRYARAGATPSAARLQPQTPAPLP